jgi:serine/threonine protein kinase
LSLTRGNTIGHYEITGLLGIGGMGEVYRARDTRLNRDVALKVLPEALAADGERMARLQREAQILAS